MITIIYIRFDWF